MEPSVPQQALSIRKEEEETTAAAAFKSECSMVTIRGEDGASRTVPSFWDTCYVFCDCRRYSNGCHFYSCEPVQPFDPSSIENIKSVMSVLVTLQYFILLIALGTSGKLTTIVWFDIWFMGSFVVVYTLFFGVFKFQWQLVFHVVVNFLEWNILYVLFYLGMVVCALMFDTENPWTGLALFKGFGVSCAIGFAILLLYCLYLYVVARWSEAQKRISPQ